MLNIISRRYIAKKLAKENWIVIHILNDKIWQEKDFQLLFTID